MRTEASLVGATLDGRYAIRARLGEGGMGAVYEATQASVGRRVAVKVLRPELAGDPIAAQRFLQEARATCALSHPNIITVHDFGESQDGLLYLVMERVDGEPLSRLIKTHGAMSGARAATLVAQILNALHEAHGAGVVHRDLKPDNVLVVAGRGGRDFVKVLDFGLARMLTERGGTLTQPGEVFGTPAYMSPEQAKGTPADHRADLYAVGCIFYELLAGRRPFDAPRPLAVLMQHLRHPPPAFESLEPPVEVPPPLKRVVFRALEKDPDARYDSAADMLADLDLALDEAGVSVGARRRTGPSASKRAPAVAGALLRLDGPEGVAEALGARPLSDAGIFAFDDASAALDLARAWHAALGAMKPPRTGRAAIHAGAEAPAPALELALAVAGPGRTLLTREAAAALGTQRVAHDHGHWRRLGPEAPRSLFELPEPGVVPKTPVRGSSAWQVHRVGGEWAPVHAVPGHLPRALDAFVGRAAERAALSRRLAEGVGLLSVVGMGGTGKSRLALRCARAWSGAWPGGVWFCDLNEARCAEDVLHAVARALDVPLGSADPVGQLGHAIAGRGPCLLVLDGFEHIASQPGLTVGRWQELAPGAQILVTTREVLGLPGEVVFPLGPLSLDDAAALFDARAALADATYEPEPAVVHELVARLDRLPLAIELTAARIRTLSSAKMLERVSDRFKLVRSTGSRRGRQANLRATLDWSWAILPDGERKALSGLSAFEGGFDLESAEAVVGERAYTLVTSLVDRSLLRPASDGRFSLLATVQHYAVERLGGAVRRAAEVRHGAYFAALGTDDALAALDGAAGSERRAAMVRDFDNLVAACRRAVDRLDPDVAVGALRAAWAVSEIHGGYERISDLAERISSLPSMEPAARAEVLRTGAESLWFRGELDSAEERLEAALAIAVEIGDRRGEGRCLRRLGVIADQRRAPDAEARLEAAVEAARAAGDILGESDARNALGVVAYNDGRPDAALHRYREALALVGDGSRRQSKLLANMAIALSEQSHHDEARALTRDALERARATGDRTAERYQLSNLATFDEVSGELELAAEHSSEALALSTELGDRIARSFDLAALGSVLRLLGEAERARDALTQAIALAQKVGATPAWSTALRVLALLDLEAGRLDAALAGGRRAVEVGASMPFPHAMALQAFARVAVAAGEVAAARRAIDRARGLRQGGRAHALVAVVDALVSAAEGRPTAKRAALDEATGRAEYCRPGSEVAGLVEEVSARDAERR